MKIAVASDIHYGTRQDNVTFLDHYKRYWNEHFFPILIDREISTVIIPGDLLDRRKFVNIQTAQRMREDFLEPLSRIVNDVYIIAGNHDCHFDNTNETNSLVELMRDYGFHIMIEPQDLLVGNTDICFLPWICRDNRERALECIKNTKAQICVAHLQLQGFEMHTGQVCENGMDRSLFDKFELVMTGHFHHPSRQGNIQYLGSVFYQNWNDYNDNRGFHILDTDTRKLSYIKNPFELFHKVVYDDTGKSLEYLDEWDWDFFKGGYVHILVKNKENAYLFEEFRTKLESYAVDVKTMESRLITLGDNTVEEVDDTPTILRKSIAEIETDETTKKLLEELILVDLYNQAIQMEI